MWLELSTSRIQNIRVFPFQFIQNIRIYSQRVKEIQNLGNRRNSYSKLHIRRNSYSKHITKSCRKIECIMEWEIHIFVQIDAYDIHFNIIIFERVVAIYTNKVTWWRKRTSIDSILIACMASFWLESHNSSEFDCFSWFSMHFRIFSCLLAFFSILSAFHLHRLRITIQAAHYLHLPTNSLPIRWDKLSYNWKKVMQKK